MDMTYRLSISDNKTILTVSINFKMIRAVITLDPVKHATGRQQIGNKQVTGRSIKIVFC